MLTEFNVSAVLESAIAHHEAGELDQAENLYRRILQYDNDDLDALNLLGAIAQDRGDLDESISLLSRATELDAEFVDAFVNLARAQSAAGNAAMAVASARRAVELEPRLAEAHLQLGRALLVLNLDEEAVAACREAARLAPASLDALMDLGVALARTGDHAASGAVFHQAVRLRPDHAPALHALASELVRERKADLATAYAERAVDLAPNNVEHYLGLAQALREDRNVERSFEVAQQALEMEPERVDLHILQGDNLTLLGRSDEAVKYYNCALKLEPGALDAIAGLSRVSHLAVNSPEADRLRKALVNPDQSVQGRITAGFSLGTALDRSECYDEAFASFAIANGLAREGFINDRRAFDLTALSHRVDWLMDAFRLSTFEETAGWGSTSELPVFIVGLPRSGTTLVEQIAASHPLVFGAGERQDIAVISERLEGPTIVPPRQWNPEAVREEAANQVELLHRHGKSALRVLDKLPDNILLLGHITVLFPKARVIICQRDLRDVGLSCFFQPFRDGLAWTFDLGDTAARICETERLLDHWRSVLPLRAIEIRYEDLVSNLEGEARRLIEFLGLEWDPACLAFHKTDRAVMTASTWQVRQPIYAHSVGRWKRYQNHIGELLEGVAGVSGADLEVPEHRLAVAQRHHSSGRFGAAEATVRSLLAQDPELPGALSLFGQLLVRRGQLDQAQPVLERANQLLPNAPEPLLALARLHRIQGDLKNAAVLADKACRLTRESFDAHLLSGTIKVEKTDARGAIQSLLEAVRIDDTSVDAWMQLGSAFLLNKDVTAAESAYRSALRLRPDNAEALSKLGFLLSASERHEEALAYHRQAIGLAPNELRAHLGMAMAAWQARRIIDCIQACERILELDPNCTAAWLIFGSAQSAFGHFADAEVAFQRVLQLDPENQDARLGLAEIVRDRRDTSEEDWLSRVLNDPTKSVMERVTAGFSLGTVLDRSAEYDKAFAAFAEANRLVRESRPPPKTRVGLEVYREVFTPENLALGVRWGDTSEVPVFIVGMPRSGTTLVEQILGSHPLVFAAGERKDMSSIVAKLETTRPFMPPSEWSPLTIQKEAAWHIARLEDLGGGAIRVVDKMPDNLRFLGHISVLFPGARVVVCRRDLRDVSLSCFFRRFTDETLDWANDLEDIADRARSNEDLLVYWREHLPIKMIEVQYEALVGNLEAEARRLIDFLGLEWDPACLSFHQTERAIFTASQWQVRQPIYDTSIGRWRHYKEHLGPLLEGLKGYISEEL